MSPEHLPALLPIFTHTAPHSRTFCACPPWCPTLPCTSTRSITPLVMTAAHGFGWQMPSPHAAGPPAPHCARRLLLPPTAPSRTRPVGRQCSPSHRSCSPRSPTSEATNVPRGSVRRHPLPPPHRPPPPNRRGAPCIFHADASLPVPPPHLAARRRHAPRAPRLLLLPNVPHPLAPAGALSAFSDDVQPPVRTGSSPPSSARSRSLSEESVARRRGGVFERNQRRHRVAHCAFGGGPIDDGCRRGGGGRATCRQSTSPPCFRFSPTVPRTPARSAHALLGAPRFLAPARVPSHLW